MKQTEQFSRDWLPCLGVSWRRFPTHSEALAFANWAERTTEQDQWPCESFVTETEDAPPDERFEVKVRNW
jgi:hypothetical protein